MVPNHNVVVTSHEVACFRVVAEVDLHRDMAFSHREVVMAEVVGPNLG